MSTSLGIIERTNLRTHELGQSIGNFLVDLFHLIALFAIGATIVWAAVFSFIGMIENRSATVSDILLLFIFLELGAMVGIYFKTNHMPVRFLIYVAITALTRLLLELVSVEHKSDFGILIVSGSILVLAISVLAIRYGSNRFPATSLD
ncbi:MAG TPA: phosphate-starvation-inducible protein PsiE [Rhodospirillales bacterium]|nr:phosphate-starvation-inducible protein PsiE [Rhodospirillales bacterium]